MIQKARTYWLVGLVLFALLELGKGGYIYVKAIVAQWLIEDAWNTSIETRQRMKPWVWADTWPIAKLTAGEESHYILNGASMSTLAFGPGHLEPTPFPGELGNSVVLGHRDTHFRLLKGLAAGDVVKIENKDESLRYEVSEIRIVHKTGLTLPDPVDTRMLSFITCYPFDAIASNTPWRYVVIATAI